MRGPILLLFGVPLFAQGLDQFFEAQIRPLLAERCYACHSKTAMSGLRLDSREALLKGGARGPAIVPGNPAASLLLAAVKQSDPKLKMPPQGRLEEREVAAVEHWIRAGAPWPGTPTAASESGEFWSFRALGNPGGAIDSLVRAKLETKGLRQNPPADRHALARRVSFDLTGLPPAPGAADLPYERLVEQLLASPRLGERWGRHWLDVARFGEEDFTGTAPRFYANAWRYRDWVIGAFNTDMPYDRFVKAQIAADLIDGDRSALIGGLGLFGLGPWYYSIAQPQQSRADERHDRVDVITRGFLGLTGACARCHDHKYDPITMKDYYALAGVFASSKYEEYPLASPSEVKRYKDAQAAIKAHEAKISKFLEAQRDQVAEMFAHRIADAMMGGESVDSELRERFRKYLSKPEEEFPYLAPWHAAVASGAPRDELRGIALEFQTLVIATANKKRELDADNAAIKGAAAKSAPVKRRKTVLPGGYDSEADFNPGADLPVASLERDRMLLWRRFFLGKEALLRFEEDKIERFLQGPWKDHLAGLRAELDRLKKASPQPYGFHAGIAEHEEPIDLPMAVRGNPYVDGDPVPRRFLSVLADSPARWTKGSGRRELAESIARSPIAARVMANRIWMHLTGAGIVSTPSIFGRGGDRPSNPALLEYLAWRFRASGFSTKSLIREIVLSETYRASSAANPANDAIDAGNRLFWRANRRRLDAESLRDSILAVTGALDGRTGGESALLDDNFRRRAVYARVSRFKQEETLTLFDFPAASVSAEKRPSTNVPPQKLYFLNSPFLLRQSEVLGKRMKESGLDNTYRLLFGRPADKDEERLARGFVKQAGTEGWTRLAQVLLSSNEFSFVD